ncbi:CBS domain-containing protein [Bacillus massilinigeriensis]|uniref:CBS domain-containing protein n=1 Tax=Bacillus mediterraneensis TaxID=1805474 RepID=UPI0008F8BE4C|nr:CBS domain-containing protein [Bacillus mediterraneensis]
MFIKSIMIPKFKCVTIRNTDSLEEAFEKLEAHSIDALPVLDGDIYLGIVTRYGILKGYFDSGTDKTEYLKNTKAAEAVVFEDKYLTGSEIFETTLLELKDFPLMAVVNEEGKQFLGVVTRADVLEQFESAFGVKQKGVRIAFTSVETEGRIARLAEIAHQFHEHIISLVTFDETDKLVRRIVMKVEKKDNVDKFIDKLEQSGFRILNIHED